MEDKTINLMELKGEETEAVLNHDTSDSVLIQVKELPSGFKGYPAGTIISYEPIKMAELEALNPTNDIEPTRAVAMLLKAIRCNTMNVQDLYYWDVMYIGIQRKLQAFGEVEGILADYCPKCRNVVSHRFKYTDIEFKELKVPDLPIKLEISGKKVECAPLSIKKFLQFNLEDGELGIFAHQIHNMPFEDAYSLVKNAIGVDIKKLKFIDKQLDYGMKPFIEECDNVIEVNGKKEPCKEQVVLEVRSPFEVVFPEDILNGDPDFEVQYG